MDAKEKEEKFCALIMALQNGNVTIARRVFDFCIQNEVNDKLDLAISLSKKHGHTTLSRELLRLKSATRHNPEH